MNGEVKIEFKDGQWNITSIGTRFLDWMHTTFGDQRDQAWRVYYYSGSMVMMSVTEPKIITATTLKWL